MALNGAVLAALLQSCAPNVAPPTLLAIIQVESKGDPFQIGVNSGASLVRQPENAGEAVATAKGLLARGANFDAGLMQVNSANFGRLGLTAETVFDPCTNIRAGAAVLTDNYRRARDAGSAAPLQAALSQYNTGSTTRGLSNGYVGKVYRAAGQPYAPQATPTRAFVPSGWTPAKVARLILQTWGGRITDTLRPMNAIYGAENSFHKFAQAVDFVPSGGVGAINRSQIRSLMAANGIELLELLGPGDPDHSDHWHVAFALNGTRPFTAETTNAATFALQEPWRVVPRALASDAGAAADAGADPALPPVLLAASYEPQQQAAPPPAWDVFASAAWRRQEGLQ